MRFSAVGQNLAKANDEAFSRSRKAAWANVATMERFLKLEGADGSNESKKKSKAKLTKMKNAKVMKKSRKQLVKATDYDEKVVVPATTITRKENCKHIRTSHSFIGRSKPVPIKYSEEILREKEKEKQEEEDLVIRKLIAEIETCVMCDTIRSHRRSNSTYFSHKSSSI